MGQVVGQGWDVGQVRGQGRDAGQVGDSGRTWGIEAMRLVSIDSPENL